MIWLFVRWSSGLLPAPRNGVPARILLLEVAMQVVLGVLRRVHHGVVDARVVHGDPADAIGVLRLEGGDVPARALRHRLEVVVVGNVAADLPHEDDGADRHDDEADDLDGEQHTAAALRMCGLCSCHAALVSLVSCMWTFSDSTRSRNAACYHCHRRDKIGSCPFRAAERRTPIATERTVPVMRGRIRL